jgi:putative ABC transport system permease protein
VVIEAGRLLGLGVGLGLAGALLVTEVLDQLLFGVGPRDPLSFLGSVGLLVAAALLASLVPARRASRLDPMIALRS